MTPQEQLLRLQDWLYEVLFQNRGESVTFKRRAIEDVYVELSTTIELNRFPVSSPVTPPPSQVAGPGAGGSR